MNRPGNENEHRVKEKYKPKIITNALHVETKKRKKLNEKKKKKQIRTTERVCVCVIEMADCLSAWVSLFIHAQYINIQIQ